MSDVRCPYCGKEQEIDHDEGYGYEEDKHHEQECIACDKTFKFVTRTSFDYEVFCRDDDHVFKERRKGVLFCEKCDFIKRFKS